MLRQRLPALLAMYCLLLLCTGCGPAASSKSSPAPEGGSADGVPAADASAELESLIGMYMPPLEGGAVEVAAPKDWEWGRAGSNYLVGFHPVGASLNDLPRILLAADDSPWPGIEEVDSTNAADFVQQVAEKLKDDQLRSPAAAVTLGGRTWCEHVELRKSRETLVARQVLQTVVNGRLYSIRLEVFDRQLSGYRNTARAVAASCRFSTPAAAATGDDPATDSPASPLGEQPDS